MDLLIWVIVFSCVGGVLSVIAASLLLLIPDSTSHRLMPHMVSFAIGALLGAAFLGLLPHALESASEIELHRLLLTVLLGLLGFFLLEKIVLRHCHSDHCDAHVPEMGSGITSRSAGTLYLIGDFIHNIVDGVLIAAAFLSDTSLGVVTSLAVAAHEIPQEMGGFAILLRSGFSRKRALVWNLLVSLSTVVGAVCTYYTLSGSQTLLPYVLALAASSFIYVAVADLIPGLHDRTQTKATVAQLFWIGLGITVMYVSETFLHV